MPRKLKFVRKSKSSRAESNGMTDYTDNHLRTIIAIEEANKYEPAEIISEVKIEGYDSNFSASVNAKNAMLRHEETFKPEINWRLIMTRIFYPQIWFYTIVLFYITV